MPISVGAAGKVGDGVNAYYVFKVTSDMFSIEPLEVDRRYSDFLWLHTQLSKQCAGYIIPPLPAKVVSVLQGPEFLERRRQGLERFLRKIVEHDELKNTNCFKSFLECSAVELTALKTESQRADGATASLASVTQRTNSWWSKAYQRMSENDKVKMIAAKAGRDMNSNTIEDQEFDELLKYVSDLHSHVKSFNAKVQNAHKQNRLAAGAYCEMIECMNTVADIEESSSGTPTCNFAAVLAILDTRARQIDGELENFSMSVDDFARWVGAVVNAIYVREDRRFVYQVKLAAKGKGANGGDPQDRELQEAKEDFDTVHARVMSEVARFRAEKATELRRMFAEYARLQLRCNAEMSAVLTNSLPVLETPAAQMASMNLNDTKSKSNGSGNDSNNANPLLDLDDMRKMESMRSDSGSPPSTIFDRKPSSYVNPVFGEGPEPYADVRL
ncbi:TPA: hypothetical protein N0F65_011307 [Lagenidium giganteum]|uniref:PX domain-containing protein n=1 Tax=Lagenidium giganteum TaxID=4803 RepID=A0AAV2YJY8_9STRA|nr:TPA: hypothetical protein N0F65_011307 [Lagenidium giganteum]